LAPIWLSLLLALEVTIFGRPAADRGGAARVDPADDVVVVRAFVETFGFIKELRQPGVLVRRRPQNGSPINSLRPMVGMYHRVTSSVTAMPSTVTSSSAFGRWAFGIGLPRRDRRGRTVL
jgi:hypothetical protein